MIYFFSELKKDIKLNREYHNKSWEYDKDGKLIVDLKVKDDSNFLSPYCTTNSDISNEVEDFIEDNVPSSKSKNGIHLRIHSDVIDEKEKLEYTNAIHFHYETKRFEVYLEKRRMTFIAVIMAIIAIMALSAMIVLEYHNVHSVAISVIDIFAWVFMWEAVDILFIQCTILRHRQRKFRNLAECEVEFQRINEKTVA